MRFQSTHPRGVRHHQRHTTGVRLHVSIHAPTWGATREGILREVEALFQSTHPRGVRPHNRGGRSLYRGVSIHAPTWGATQADDIDPLDGQVSIHAPTWGATRQYQAHIRRRQFQSTHPRGVRPAAEWCEHYSGRFQSTHPRGVRRQKDGKYTGDTGFNPRTHVGCDGAAMRYHFVQLVSIHAPTWGATLLNLVLRLPLSMFQSTHPRGVRRKKSLFSYLIYVSIHAPTWGATFPSWVRLLRLSMFQSTHPRGVRLSSVATVIKKLLFQSTHPRGVRLSIN